MSFDRWVVCGVLLAIMAILTGGFGTFLLFILPSIIRDEVDKQTHLGFTSNGSLTDTTKKWVNPTYTLSMNIYTFSVRNPDQVVLGSKPILIEKGPYSFREIQKKEVKFASGSTRVLYKNDRFYFFDRNASCATCSLNDLVTIPNIVLQNILDAVKSNIFFRSVFDAIFKKTGEKVFITTSVRELLFEGYADPLISKWCVDMIKPLCNAMKIPERIGLFYQRNGTNDGTYEINTGLTDNSLIGKVYTFNNKTTVSAWYGEQARMINGTDGQLYAPGLDRRDSSLLQLFIGQICRTIEMEHYGKQNYKDVPVYLYRPAKSMNNVDYQRSMGFCNPNSPVYFNNTYIQQKGCLPAGLMDVSSCLPGNPKIYMSQPHFFGSNQALRDALLGMRAPNADNDQTVIGIEPSSGGVVFAQQRTQLNLGVTNGNILSLQNLHSRIIPVIWFNETATFDSDTREQLLALATIRSRTFIAGIVLYVLLGSAIIGIVCMLFVRRARRQSEELDHRPLFNEEDEEAPQPNSELFDNSE